MVKFLRDYGFFLFLGVFVLCFICFVAIISIAPHNGVKMRGFAPCTYQMTEKLMVQKTLKHTDVFKIIAKGYGCYFKVVAEGAVLFCRGQQATPWANYLFRSEEQWVDEDGIDEDLEQNSLLKDDDENDLLDNVIKESIDE